MSNNLKKRFFHHRGRDLGSWIEIRRGALDSEAFFSVAALSFHSVNYPPLPLSNISPR